VGPAVSTSTLMYVSGLISGWEGTRSG
jgi:hypothetical protein